MDYFELRIDVSPKEPWSGILIAELAENGYESFQETDFGVLAYAPLSAVDVANPVKNTFLDNQLNDVCAFWSSSIIKHQNWNAEWEAQFDPVYVEDYLTILAPFHDQSIAKGLIIEIMPKMSFGTGHHQTTWLMAKALFELTDVPDPVLDMGTGTGVLAIIADKLGAKDVVAVDIEKWSVENAIENVARNHCNHIKILCGDANVLDGFRFDLILANINKNVLRAHFSSYAKVLNDGGRLFISGFFISDVDELLLNAASYGFQKMRILSKDNWAAIELKRHAI
jgi:ribosomal protein L11 methyltransferase